MINLVEIEKNFYHWRALNKQTDGVDSEGKEMTTYDTPVHEASKLEADLSEKLFNEVPQ